MTPELKDRAAALLRGCEARRWQLATAESCTGGLVAALLTEIPGSSAVVERGFVTYSNDAKTEMLGVPSTLLVAYGAVSEEVARAMADGALAHSRADIAVAITGVAGPGGGSEAKPVGLVHFALAHRGRETQVLVRRYGDLGRQIVRLRAVEEAMRLLESTLTA
jgi:nicotinamide-nucleotide amidase